ncbi:MAG: hypothetical protein ACLQVL_18145 [Terriglobia bacterium]
MISWVEFGLVMAALALAFAFPYLGSRWFEIGERVIGKLAARPRLSVVVAGLTALAARAALLPVLPIPDPAVHDEFSNLLAADTFAHGRLANPTHPLWVHFETFHVLWHPTYSSMYPPAQGLLLAFGQVVLGHPFWGVWLSLGLMCGALCWMLQGWLPPRWALLGGVLAAIRLATFGYWANSYFGGAVAATGGALVFGAFPRLKRSPRVPDALLLGLGLAVLANSRPYEGLVFSLPIGVALLAWMMRGKGRPSFTTSVGRIVLPTGLLLGLVAMLMGYYFWRVTGSPWRMPQQVNREIYAEAPYFPWQSPRPIPTYHHEVLKDFYLNVELPQYVASRTLRGLILRESAKAVQVWLFYVQPLYTLPLIMALVLLPRGFSWREISPGTRFLLMALGFGLAGYAAEVYYNPHYPSPGTCLVYALVLGAMRYLRSWRWHEKPVGLAITRAIPLIACTLLVFCAATASNLRLRQAWPAIWKYPGWQMPDRALICAQLQREPGDHLVIVRYSPAHNSRLEWVYNGADIDASKVVWARDMGRQQNAELLTYFHGRRIWLVEADSTPPCLSAYPAD